jgi:hypothetical protein
MVIEVLLQYQAMTVYTHNWTLLWCKNSWQIWTCAAMNILCSWPSQVNEREHNYQSMELCFVQLEYSLTATASQRLNALLHSIRAAIQPVDTFICTAKLACSSQTHLVELLKNQNIKMYSSLQFRGHISVVMDWVTWLRGWTLSPGTVKNFQFFMLSRPVLGSNQPPIKWVPEALSPIGRDVKLTPSPPTSTEVHFPVHLHGLVIQL